MKHLLIFFIIIYRAVVSPLLNQLLGVSNKCRFSPTCAEYTQQAIKQYGILHGVKKGIVRLSHCHPLSKHYGNI